MTAANMNAATVTKSSNDIIHAMTPVEHREDEYDPKGIDILLNMQSKHFWYRGRHRFLLRAFHNEIRNRNYSVERLSCVDLGGGCGGWVKYLNEHVHQSFRELALADSSQYALELSDNVVGRHVNRYQVDLLNLQWKNRWDVAFLLDVLEHIPEHERALRQIYQALKPGGLLFVTTPALKLFWSYNDELAHHVRRYCRKDFEQLANTTGFTHCYSRYFMFFLSPLLLLSRLKRPDLQKMSQEQIREHLNKTHRIPSAPVNGLLQMIFSLETPLGLKCPFPWGTSVLGVFLKR